jgi:hypothetical protein
MGRDFYARKWRLGKYLALLNRDCQQNREFRVNAAEVPSRARKYSLARPETLPKTFR